MLRRKKPMNNSPYENKPVEDWKEITLKLIGNHPLSRNELVDAVLQSWGKILRTRIGNELKIGEDVFPSPQIMGNYLHLMISHYFQKKYPDKWRVERDKNDKDLVCLDDDSYSIEIKTSSQNTIFGNRSYGQETESDDGKQKYGYYLAILFEKFKDDGNTPKIKLIKFGWIDHSDWKAQKSPTGQNSTLSKDAWNHKLETIYEFDNEKIFKTIEDYLAEYSKKHNS